MRNETLLTPPTFYGAINNDDDSDGAYQIPPSFAISLEKHDDHPDNLSQKLLTRAQSFGLPQDCEQGFHRMQLKLFSIFTSAHASLSWQLNLLLSTHTCIPMFAICHVSSIAGNCYFSPFNKK
jgi:hypothetical protein